MKQILLILCIIINYFFNVHVSLAKSTYVLPYPGIMPGNILYKLTQIQEKLQEKWYFGSFASFEYNKKYSDKYLVEAKTLFEYEQYFLGYQALVKSNKYFKKIPDTLVLAAREGKDISEKKALFIEESEKHREVLEALLKTIPESIEWAPEKEKTTFIPLHKALFDAISIRKIL